MMANSHDATRLIDTVKALAPPKLEGSFAQPAVVRGRRPAKGEAPADRPKSGADTTFRLAVEGHKATAGLFDSFKSGLEYLEKPFLIWQYPNPNLDQFVDSHLESFNSRARIKLYGEGGHGSFHTQLGFHYFWQNSSAGPVVIDVSCPLVVTGRSYAGGSGGFFGGNLTQTSAVAFLFPRRWIGWGSDPTTGESLDQTLIGPLNGPIGVNITQLSARGGWGPFYSTSYISETFDHRPFSMSVYTLLVPSGASILLPAYIFFYGSMEGDTLSDQTRINFSDGGSIVSPYMLLSVHTPG